MWLIHLESRLIEALLRHWRVWSGLLWLEAAELMVALIRQRRIISLKLGLGKVSRVLLPLRLLLLHSGETLRLLERRLRVVACLLLEMLHQLLLRLVELAGPLHLGLLLLKHHVQLHFLLRRLLRKWIVKRRLLLLV